MEIEDQIASWPTTCYYQVIDSVGSPIGRTGTCAFAVVIEARDLTNGKRRRVFGKSFLYKLTRPLSCRWRVPLPGYQAEVDAAYDVGKALCLAANKRVVASPTFAKESARWAWRLGRMLHRVGGPAQWSWRGDAMLVTWANYGELTYESTVSTASLLEWLRERGEVASCCDDVEGWLILARPFDLDRLATDLIISAE